VSYEVGRRLDLQAVGGLRVAYRPGWPDPYDTVLNGNGDPVLDGSGHPQALSSARLSHFDWVVGFGVTAHLARKQWAWGRYEINDADYATSDSYDAANDPAHLVPSDYTRHQMQLGWRHIGEGWRATGTLDLTRKGYDSAFARDALTGATHAGPGGLPANPPLAFNIMQPGVAFSSWLIPDTLRLGAGYAVEVSSDTFQGYYSYVCHEPSLSAEYRLPNQASFEASVALHVLRYGPDSYDPNAGNHDPLDDNGSRRVDKRAEATLDGRWPITSELDAIGRAALRWRETNYPDYTLANSNYEIDWDYTDFQAYAGVEYRWGR
ncbi:MAG: hypothetical protein AAB426_07415, partial [Myxococcota bacterium]